MDSFYARKREIALIQEFLNKPGSGLTYLRGRRRIGKSKILKYIEAKHVKRCFYFAGVLDETLIATKRRFVRSWDKFSGGRKLSMLDAAYLEWENVFDNLVEFCGSSKSKVIIILDEIQWIAKKKSGFIGLFKIAWERLKDSKKVKVILCGSSNRFFKEKSGGEEKILRGLKTSAEIWVSAFTPAEVKKHYFPNWSNEQICFLYQLIGGIPYYLEQIPADSNFIRALNQTLFTRSTIFLDEMREILNLDFRAASIERVISTLATLGTSGQRQTEIEKRTGLARSSVYEILKQLVDYSLLQEVVPIVDNLKQNRSGTRYVLPDFYLNCYFSILRPLEHRIRNNKNELLLPYQVIGSKSGYYIAGYTGAMFEALVRHMLLYRNRNSRFNKALHLSNEDYLLGTYWDKTVQFDLVIEHAAERETRLLECKWINANNFNLTDYIKDLRNKRYPNPKKHSLSYHLIVSAQPSQADYNIAGRLGVNLLTLDDLDGW